MAYLYNGATGCTAPRVYVKITAASDADRMRLLSTRKTEYLKYSLSTPYGRVMMRSCKMPYTINDPTTPTTHAAMRTAGVCLASADIMRY